MKHIYSMQHLCVSLRASLLLSLIFFTHSTFALESATSESKTIPYQSAFDGYQPATNDSPSDWKTINNLPNDGGHSGHQMQGMQHDMDATMNHDNMTHNDAPEMDHSSMAGMNHQKMQHGNMDHTNTSQASMQIATKPDVDMSTMDHAQMQRMTHQHAEPARTAHQHEEAMPAMQEMDHSKMADMSQAGEAAEENHSEHHHAGEDEMQAHDEHDAMPVADQVQTKPEVPQTGLKIIPNLHPAIVHFPIALTLLALFFGLSARTLRAHSAVPFLAAAGHFTLWLAAFGAIVAVVLGWLAFNSGMNHDDAGHAAMLLHRKWAIPTALGLVLLAGWDAWKCRINQVMSIPVLIYLLVLSGAIATTAWLGGEIVYRHGIGVMSIPPAEGAGHNHQHGGTNMAEHAHEAATPDEHAGHQHDDTQGGAHEH